MRNLLLRNHQKKTRVRKPTTLTFLFTSCFHLSHTFFFFHPLYISVSKGKSEETSETSSTTDSNNQSSTSLSFTSYRTLEGGSIPVSSALLKNLQLYWEELGKFLRNFQWSDPVIQAEVTTPVPPAPPSVIPKNSKPTGKLFAYNYDNDHNGILLHLLGKKIF